ncbi:Zinc finger and BTB domain-containing protein 41 [Frankliniella fusca]|uniref:Zinc finger and BTB domain-containing protein 41 n=1 Tax=Frankliniella fusca TaxID=407009 RepID=A0AAE1I467_9NEOP|nr:Zinc finger and BTB domain-containing protein 41 [Frankliniella fusca]
MAPSSVWTLVTKSKDGKTATCSKCSKSFKNPSTIRYHLQQVHFIITPKNPSNKQKEKDISEVGVGSSEAEDDPEPVNGTGDRSKRPRSRQEQNAEQAGASASNDGQAQAPGASQRKSFEGPLDKCISNSLSFSRGGHRDKQVTDSLLFMMAKDDLPLSTPEKEGFRVFCKALQPQYSVPSEPYCTAATKKGKSRIHSVELGVRFMPERKNTDNIAAATRSVCEEWQIDIEGKVSGVTTDGGANVKAAVRQVFGTLKHIVCAGHVIKNIGQAVLDMNVTPRPSEATPDQVAADALVDDEDDDAAPSDEREDQAQAAPEPAVTSVHSLMVEVKRIVRFFRTSEVASAELK